MAVNIGYQVIVGGNEAPVLQFKEQVGRLVINGSNSANGCAIGSIDDGETYKKGQCWQTIIIVG